MLVFWTKHKLKTVKMHNLRPDVSKLIKILNHFEGVLIMNDKIK